MLLILPFRLTVRLALLTVMTFLVMITMIRHVIKGLVTSAMIVFSQHEQFLATLAATTSEESSFNAALSVLAQFTFG